jgi:glycosyltransferase involved in cell wall biosynthesis
MRVLVAHPGMQHAYQLAWALEEAGHLAAFWSGVPVVDSRHPKDGLWGLVGNRLRAVPIAAGKRRHAVIFPLLRKLLGARLFTRVANSWNHRIDRAYGAWVARRVRKLKPDLVVCYENSAFHTFRAAHAVGAVCVLDAASIHYQAGRAWLADTVEGNPAWVDVQKQQEIDLADAILTCSDFAAETYRAAGVATGKIFPVPLGTVLPDIPLPVKGTVGRCRFVFVGSLRRLKGVDVLLDVFTELEREGVPAELALIGDVAERDLADRAEKMPNVTHRLFMPQSRLFAEVARHDCLVLLSRFDSFGMVVAEAMAVGVPAIVSDRVGAKCIVEQRPEAGWILPCDKDALKAQILQLVANRETLDTASRAARRAAQDYTWGNYRRRVVRALEDIHARYGKSDI